MVKPYLLDIILLLALTCLEHLHHQEAHSWFEKSREAGFATCPLTQLGFVRISSNVKFTKDAVAPHAALLLLDRITELPGHVFWPDNLTCQKAIAGSPLIAGHRQLTDFYLVGIARENHGKLATLDRSVADQGPFKEFVEVIGARPVRPPKRALKLNEH